MRRTYLEFVEAPENDRSGAWKRKVGSLGAIAPQLPSKSNKGCMIMNRLSGKTAVITGGATGIGLAAARRFIEEGAFVFFFGRRQEALDAAVADLEANARAMKGSVSDEGDLDRLYAAVKAERGRSMSSLPMPEREASLRSARSRPSTLTKPSTPM